MVCVPIYILPLGTESNEKQCDGDRQQTLMKCEAYDCVEHIG